jgi:hypothetical protein
MVALNNVSSAKSQIWMSPHDSWAIVLDGEGNRVALHSERDVL